MRAEDQIWMKLMEDVADGRSVSYRWQRGCGLPLPSFFLRGE